VQLLNAEGGVISATTANVRTTAFGPVALVVTGVAFALLVVTAGVRVVLRRRRGRGSADGPEPDPAPQPLEPVGAPDPL
jgi:flagellar biosynthesis/type III secretory pathway M-ring protein FliF/YscJ